MKKIKSYTGIWNVEKVLYAINDFNLPFPVTISIIATIILITGKGSKFVTGFNTKSTEERAQYDSKKVSKQAGIFMILIDVGLIALVSYIQFRAVPAIQNNTISNYGTEITIVSLGICAYIILVAMIAVIRGFKYSKK